MTTEERKQLIYRKYRSLASFARAIKEPRQRVYDILSGKRRTERIQVKIASRLKVEQSAMFGN